MLRVYHLLIGAVLLVVVPIGTRFVLPQSSQKPETPSNNLVSPTATPTSASNSPTDSSVNTENIWLTVLGKTASPDGWQVLPCQDNASLLCVSANGKPVGTVKLEVYPVKDNPDFQKHLTAVGIPFGSPANNQNNEYQNQVSKALEAWVTDFYATVANKGKANNANKVIVSTYPPQQITIGKLPGIRSGYLKIKPEGGVEEQQISHVTYDGTTLYVMSTSFAPGAVRGSFENLESLAIFQPYLDAIAANLNLPVQNSERKP
ncbi:MULTISPECIES: hypothetical protein [unclassified Anabaena]|uniref:hypothetical protein n=1 Tax=unclassified Anabaena TaxID=2619674 RepID=UPI00082B31D2|nr:MULTISPECIES: hypothetical protein [unclassified Anabaena]